MTVSDSVSSPCLSFDPASEYNRPGLVYDDLLTAEGEFRLLQIEPADNSTDPITARLFKASLADPPSYEALSYRWEQTEDAHFIMVNGIKFPVMRNVFSSLSEFRQQSYPSSPIFWIDSVCVNQDSTQDRNDQVQLMGRIYSQADLVRMWLGPESDLTDQAFELIRRCGPDNRVPAEIAAANVIQSEAGTKALTELLQRDYWNRMWVFQEIVLAKEAVVHCGKQQVPWPSLRWLDIVSSRHELWHTAQIGKPWILEFRKALFNISRFGISRNEAHHINSVLQATRHLRCQDPRDKLYALLGVCDALRWIVKVDYSVPVREVFTAFAQQQLVQDGHLSALLTAGLWSSLNGNDINLPSWVPDLRGTGDVDMRYMAASHMNSFDADGGQFAWYDAIFPIQHDDFLEYDGNSIFNAHAILFDLIQSHKPIRGITNSELDRKELIEAFCLSSEDGRFLMGRLRQLFEGLTFRAKTTLTHYNPSKQHTQERARQLIIGFYEDLCQLFGPEPVFTELLGSFDSRNPNSQGHKPLQEEVQLCDPDQLHLDRMDYLGRAAETTERQATALFLTVDGHIGMGPRQVQQGDVLVIVRGCRVPLALRQHATHYRLVGPVYVSGIMQGEVVRSHELSGFLSFEPIQLV